MDTRLAAVFSASKVVPVMAVRQEIGPIDPRGLRAKETLANVDETEASTANFRWNVASLAQLLSTEVTCPPDPLIIRLKAELDSLNSSGTGTESFLEELQEFYGTLKCCQDYWSEASDLVSVQNARRLLDVLETYLSILRDPEALPLPLPKALKIDNRPSEESLKQVQVLRDRLPQIGLLSKRVLIKELVKQSVAQGGKQADVLSFLSCLDHRNPQDFAVQKALYKRAFANEEALLRRMKECIIAWRVVA